MKVVTDNPHLNMVQQQVRPHDVLDSQVLSAMHALDRALFFPTELTGLAYAETELPIGEGEYALSPVNEGRLLQACALAPTDAVLEIGTGCGYFTGLLASLAAQVVTVEFYASLRESAQQKLQSVGLDAIDYRVGDATQLQPEPQAYNVIVSTAAWLHPPVHLYEALRIGGRLIVPVGPAHCMQVQCIVRETADRWGVETVYETAMPYIIHAEPRDEFVF